MLPETKFGWIGLSLGAVALAAVPVLLGIAAAQPVLETTHVVPERTDVEAYVVIDVSRSMLAAAGPGEPTRFERAQDLEERRDPKRPGDGSTLNKRPGRYGHSYRDVWRCERHARCGDC